MIVRIVYALFALTLFVLLALEPRSLEPTQGLDGGIVVPTGRIAVDIALCVTLLLIIAAYLWYVAIDCRRHGGKP